MFLQMQLLQAEKNQLRKEKELFESKRGHRVMLA
jgi:hypothetical protein